MNRIVLNGISYHGAGAIAEIGTILTGNPRETSVEEIRALYRALL